MDESHYSSPEIKQIFGLIEKNLITPKERAVMIDEYSIEQVKQEIAKDAMEKGGGKGIERGMEKGREEGVLMIAKNMKKTGIDVETIVQVTGLSIEQIESL